MGWLAIRVQAFEEYPHATATLLTSLMPLFPKAKAPKQWAAADQGETSLAERRFTYHQTLPQKTRQRHLYRSNFVLVFA